MGKPERRPSDRGASERGAAARRMICAAQRNDPRRLRRVIESLQLGIAIENGHRVGEVLGAMTAGRPGTHIAPVRTGRIKAALGADA